MRPLEIKYRDGKQKVVSVKADGCSGEIPAYSDTYYCIFYLKGVQVARVAKSRLLPGYYDVYTKLFGRPWLKKIREAKDIHLTHYDDWSNEIGGYPNDTDTILMVNYDHHTWVIVAGMDTKNERAILHIMNNPEVTRRGKYKEAVKKLFPGKKVFAELRTITTEEL